MHEVQALMDLAKPALQQGIVGCLYVGCAGPYICMVVGLLDTSLGVRMLKYSQKFKVPCSCVEAMQLAALCGDANAWTPADVRSYTTVISACAKG